MDSVSETVPAPVEVLSIALRTLGDVSTSKNRTYPPADRPAADVALGEHNHNPAEMSLWALWREDLDTHEGDCLNPGFWAIAVHRFGNWRMSVRPRLLRAPLSLLYRALYRVVEWTCGISLAYTVIVGRRVRIWHHGGMILGALRIGDDVNIRQNVTMGVARRGEPRWCKPIIGDRCDISAGAVIVGEIHVGADSVIGANVVLNQSVPPHSLVTVERPTVRIRTLAAAG